MYAMYNSFKILRKVACTLALIVLCGSCSDFFENDLTSVTNADGRVIATERDAFYQMCGIMQQMQRVADGYFLANELRGDLLTQTRNSSQDLRDIEFFEADVDNMYLNEREYYALVNNCNFYIDRIDRGVFGTKSDTLISQVKCIRAWAYLQLALDYGQVHYFTSPLTKVDETVDVTDFTVPDDMLAEQGTLMVPEKLVDTLIEDLRPYCPADGKQEEFPFTAGEYASIGSYPTSMLFIPVRFMLGELYMWRQDFASAANMYYQLMLDRRLTVSGSYCNKWRNSYCDEVSVRSWAGQFSSLNNYVSVIAFSNENENGMTRIPDLMGTDFQLAASPVCRETFSEQQYTIGLNAVSLPGDLRGEGVTSDYGTYVMSVPDNALMDEKTDAYITKLSRMTYSSTNFMSLCRSSLVYLRYAEAVNRLGKHQLAMAVLKYGLNDETLNNRNYVKREELSTGEPWLEFGQNVLIYQSVFKGNSGLHGRGCGDVDKNMSYFIDISGGVDSLTDVENKIMTEYVLECSFEGNRFHDLMRISQYRSDPSYLAGKVAVKLAAVEGSPRSREQWIAFLSDRRNWYLPSCIR